VKTVPVTMPDWLWGRLVMVADDLHVPVAGLIADALRRTIDDHPRVISESPFARAPGSRPARHVEALRRQERKEM
jgi:hypothetical protein